MIRRLPLALLFIFIQIFPLLSQTSVDIEKTLIMSYAESDDTALHFKALESIETRFNEKSELDSDCMSIVSAMAKSSIITEVYEDGILIKTNQEVQLAAIGLLGRIGGQEALDDITDLLVHSREYPIVYEAVSSSALIKAEDYSDFLASMVKIMTYEHYTGMDNAFAHTSLITLDSLMTHYGVLLTPDLIKIILLYNENAYMHKVQDLARVILRKYL